MVSPRALFDQLNVDYSLVHKTKEDLFWATYMATSSYDEGFARAEEAYKNFISDPQRLAAVRQALTQVPDDPPDASAQALKGGLLGWLALFESNIIDNDDARQCMAELIGPEAGLFARRRDLVLEHMGASGQVEVATLGTLATNMQTSPNEAARQSSFAALMSLERWVLDNGFLEIIKKRNAFARAKGFADYFDFKMEKNEGMSTAQLFDILDDFEQRTRDTNTHALADLVQKHGAPATQPWNLRYFVSGDVTRALDLPFTHNYFTQSFPSQGRSPCTTLQIGVALPHQLMSRMWVGGAAKIATQTRDQTHRLAEQDRLS